MASRFSDLKSPAGQCKIVSDVIHCLRGDVGFGKRLIVQFGGFLCFVSKSLVFNLHTRHCSALHPGREGLNIVYPRVKSATVRGLPEEYRQTDVAIFFHCYSTRFRPDLFCFPGAGALGTSFEMNSET